MNQRIAYRMRYYWKKACHFFGYCPVCWARINYTYTGRAICPYCGK